MSKDEIVGVIPGWSSYKITGGTGGAVYGGMQPDFRFSLRPWQLGALLAVVSAAFFALGIWVMR